jgi:phenylalanine-4-hydroxylase
MAGRTTSQALLVDTDEQRGKFFIHQPYERYSPENHRTWKQLYARMKPRWERYGTPAFQRGVEALCFAPDRIPRLSEINRFLSPLTGFQAKAVSGYIPAFLFFNCLRNRQFPTTITIRDAALLDYLPKPDIFHDVAGHVPMHTDRAFADTLVRFGECAHTAAELTSGIRDVQRRMERLTSILRAMARFFWFTIEFGLMRSRDGLKAYGSGLLSSYGEIAHSVEAPDVQRPPLDLNWAIHQSFEIHHYQPLLLVVDSFDHLFGLIDQLETWMREGKLDDVAPGAPHVTEADLLSFLHD